MALVFFIWLNTRPFYYGICCVLLTKYNLTYTIAVSRYGFAFCFYLSFWRSNMYPLAQKQQQQLLLIPYTLLKGVEFISFPREFRTFGP